MMPKFSLAKAGMLAITRPSACPDRSRFASALEAAESTASGQLPVAGALPNKATTSVSRANDSGLRKGESRCR
jgi:hypothetical protein